MSPDSVGPQRAYARTEAADASVSESLVCPEPVMCATVAHALREVLSNQTDSYGMGNVRRPAVPSLQLFPDCGRCNGARVRLRELPLRSLPNSANADTPLQAVAVAPPATVWAYRVSKQQSSSRNRDRND